MNYIKAVTISAFFFIAWLVPSCITVPQVASKTDVIIKETVREDTEYSFPRESFLFLRKLLVARVCDDAAPTDDSDCMYGTLVSSGSAFPIHDLIHGSMVLTAGHMCNDEYILKDNRRNLGIPLEKHIVDFMASYKLMTLDGKEFDAVVLNIDLDNDICMLIAKKLRIKSLLVSKYIVKPGTKVYSMAAPMGVFGKNMVPVSEGYYNGPSARNGLIHNVYTIPAAKGSSGGPILNKKGLVIGMISAVHTRANFLVFSPKLKDIQLFYTNSLNKVVKVMENISQQVEENNAEKQEELLKKGNK